ncbi:MAG: N-6 DNA methylase [Oscillospiraceae bacterium]
MVTGVIKNKIDKIWTDIWAAGVTNPLTVIEQLTYLMFIRSLDEKELELEEFANMTGETSDLIFPQSETGQAMRWSKFKDKDAREIFNIISKTDVRGDLYEYMLNKLNQSGTNGQFRTPTHIINMMVELIQPTPDDLICDPACGTAGFLVSSAEYIRKHYESAMTPEQWRHFETKAFTGYDTDQTMLRISAMNLMLHSITNPDIDYKDSVSKQNNVSGKYTVCLANPPFKGSVDAESIHDNLKSVTNTKKTELLFLALFLRLLQKGGRCACIVPDGVLFGSSKAHKAIRKELIENHQLKAVISMPSGVFKPYAGVSTAVLVFIKTDAGGTENVWFYDMKADGLSLDDKRSQVAENDIPDIIQRFHNLDGETNRTRTEQSFFVPKQEIIDNDYDLSINKYKKTEYVAVEYPPTSEIMADLNRLYQELGGVLSELGGLLNE